MALTKSQKNIERTKNLAGFSSPQASRSILYKDLENLNNSYHYFRSPSAEKPIKTSSQSADKGLSSRRLATITFSNNTPQSERKHIDYESLSNDELSKLVADIKREYQPKLETYKPKIQEQRKHLLHESLNQLKEKSKLDLNKYNPVPSDKVIDLKKRHEDISPAQQQINYSLAIPNQPTSEDFNKNILNLKNDMQEFFKVDIKLLE